MSKRVLIGPQVFAHDRTYGSGYVAVSEGRIDDVGSADRSPDVEGNDVVRLPPDYAVVPGRIDIHVHGADGADTMDATPDALRTIAAALPKEGTTSFLATTATRSTDAIEAALRNAGEFIANHQRPGFAEALGVDLEGPFVSAEKAGAQPTEHVIEPDSRLLERWRSISGDSISIVVLAPEIDWRVELVDSLRQAGVVASIGHSNATYDEAIESIDRGFSHVTHLFNGMSGFHHREPGIVGAALLRDEPTVELIADGVHVRPEAVRLAYRSIEADRLILITDSMRAKGFGPGTYDLDTGTVSVADGEVRLPDGTLAGSVLRMDRAIDNLVEYTGCSMREAIRMTSENPAKRIDVFDRKSSIRAGKDANLVVLDANRSVAATLCRGAVAYRSDTLNSTFQDWCSVEGNHSNRE